jgi:hypothetical protein
MNESLLKLNSWKYYLMVVGLSVLLAFAFNYLFISDSIYYQSFGEKLATERIAKMIVQSQKLQWLGYVFIPVVVLIRVSFTATCLYTGYFVANMKVRFRDLFKVALLADFVFVLAGFTKLVILIFFKEVNTLDDLQLQPLSLMDLFNRKSIDALFIYPLSLISVFEFLYWLVLAWLLTGVIEKPFGSSLKTVASSYGTGLLFWVLFVMFLTVNLT